MLEDYVGGYGLERMPNPPHLTRGFARTRRDQRLGCKAFSTFVDRRKFDRNAPRQATSKPHQHLFIDQVEVAPKSSGASD